ncbi:MAG: hypothetical protein FJ333_07755 [Sphingomonadales bacterium]|nr:hypothetical protein [Sphingomonadales bacterium]
MNPESFKPMLERDKVFLEELYSSTNVVNSKRLLNFASDVKLNTVIRLFYFLSNGEIKMKREHFEKIPSRLIKLLRRHFEKKAALTRLLQSERQQKLKILCKFLSVLQELLYPLFNEA